MRTQYAITLAGNKKVDAQVRGFTVRTDQSQASGGEDSAPSPFELFLASIGTCAGFFVASFCQSRSIPTEGIRLVQTVTRSDATLMVESVAIHIVLPADFPDKYRAAVVKAAEACTVKKHLAAPPDIRVSAAQQSRSAGLDAPRPTLPAPGPAR